MRYFYLPLALAIASIVNAYAAGPFAYVASEKSGTISVIDIVSDEVVHDIKVGGRPRGSAISKDGKILYVSDQPNNKLLILNLEQLIVTGQINLGESPEGVSASPDGKWVIAASEITNSVNFVSAASGKKIFSVRTKGKNPEHAVFTPDSKLVFVSILLHLMYVELPLHQK